MMILRRFDKPFSLPGVGCYATRTTQNLESLPLGPNHAFAARVFARWAGFDSGRPAPARHRWPARPACAWRRPSLARRSPASQMVAAFLIGPERTSLAYPPKFSARMHIIVSREL